MKYQTSEMMARLEEYLKDRSKPEFIMEEKDRLSTALDVLATLKEQNPDIDLNYVVTGKHEQVVMSAGLHNFSSCKIDNLVHNQNCLFMGKEAIEYIDNNNESMATAIHDLMKEVNNPMKP